MVVQDLDFLFDMLDINAQGFLTIGDIQLFEETTFFDPLDLDQIRAAFITSCNEKLKCSRSSFTSLLKELERRRYLEEKIKWDFKALDNNCDDRISLEAALFLFKSIHVKTMSTKHWNYFLSSRIRPEDEVSFHEIKMFLCNYPEADSHAEKDFSLYNSQLRESQTNRDYNLYKTLSAMQDDDTSAIRYEQEKQQRSENLKGAANHLIDRLEDIGLQALLEDDDGQYGRSIDRPCERVNAIDLLDGLKRKYSLIRDKLLVEMLKVEVGEGMWTAMSVKQQNERIFQLKMEEESLRKEEKLEEKVQLPGSKSGYNNNLLWLMGESMAQKSSREKAIEDKMKENGMEYDDVFEEFEKNLRFEEKQTATAIQLLIQLQSRWLLENDIVSSRLQGIGTLPPLYTGERESLFALIIMMQIRALNEVSFEDAAVWVGLTERLLYHQAEITEKDHKRHEQLAMKRLVVRKGQRKKIENVLFVPLFHVHKQEPGRIDVQTYLIENMEKRLFFEREAFIQFLQGKDCTQYRINAKKLDTEERASQLLVLKTQWQGWQNRSSEEKMLFIEQHRAILQEAVAIVFVSKKEELKMMSASAVDDFTVACSLLSELQFRQEAECMNIISFSDKDKSDLERMSAREIKACTEEWFDNIASVIFGLKDVSDEEEELIKALNDKYDALRDKMLLEALKKQMSDADWAKLSEQERQAKLTRMKLMERRLRRDGKFDEAAALLGDAMKNAELVQSMLGESRQRYLDKIQERLRARKKKILEGDADEDDDIIVDDDEIDSTGNILKDLQMRYEEEKEMLLRRLREGEGRLLNEKQRQAELMRLRLEKRRAEREENFEGAALVLGLAERNLAAKEEGLKNDRERQEQLARQRLEARRNAKKKKIEAGEDPEPGKDDLAGWQDAVIKELDRKHLRERDFFIDLMKDPDIEDLCDEAKNMSDVDKNERMAKLKDKREELDFEDSSDQEEHGAILEMAAAVKMIIRQVYLGNSESREGTVTMDDVIVSLMADLQQLQDKETDTILQDVKTKTQEELAALRTKQIKSRNYEELSNVAEVIFKYEGKGEDKEILKALDKKYDALMDKLMLEALKKQLGDAEWAAMSEKERQAEILKRRLEQKRLLREGQLEEASRLLGEGFEIDANLRKLMGQNRARYEQAMKERLERRREKIRLGIPVDEDDDKDDGETEDENETGKTDAKSIMEDMHQRYLEEKEALMRKLKGADAKYLSEKERQAELVRIRREQRRVEQEEKFGAAALVFGLAERNQAAVESMLKSDRVRQEELAKERLERMRQKKQSKQKDIKLVTDGDLSHLREAVTEHIEQTYLREREALVEILDNDSPDLMDKANCMTFGNREERLAESGEKLLQHDTTAMEDERWWQLIYEMSALKKVNRMNKLKSAENQSPTKNDIIISLMADLQQRQDEDSERRVGRLEQMERDDLIKLQNQEIEIQKSKRWMNIVKVLSSAEKTEHAATDVLIDALESKYEILKDKLLLEALESRFGHEEWSQLTETEKFNKLMELKIQMNNLLKEGKLDELNSLIGELFPDDEDAGNLLKAQEEARRMLEKEQLRKKRKEEGMSDDEIEALEKEEDKQFEEEQKKKSHKNILLNLEHNFEAERDALIAAMNGANAKFLSERERQAELARLKREQRKARKEDNYESAALVLTLAKTQQAALEGKLKNDRERQEQLAKARLLARKNRNNKIVENNLLSEEILRDTNDMNELQEQILVTLENKHADERNFIGTLIQNIPGDSLEAKVKDLDIISKQRRLNELKQLRIHWRESEASEMSKTNAEQVEVFKEAAALKIHMYLDENKEGDIEKASINILADLQDNQDKEAEFVMKNLSSKDMNTLKQLRNVQYMACNEKWYDNVAATLLDIKRVFRGHTEATDDDIVDALDSKYSELKNKLFLDALKRKFGEEEWEKMTKEEQQEQMNLLRSEDSKIQNGEEITESEMTGTQVQSTTVGEMLKNLQSQYEDEKNALLAGLQGADAKLMSEKDRQLALIKLRREKQKIKREDKFDSAAIIFNMAQQNKKQQETSYAEERARQEELAKSRLAALRMKRSKASENSSQKMLEEHQKDAENDIRLEDSLQREGTMAAQNFVLEEMEKKHYAEQEGLTHLLSLIELDKEAIAAASYLTISQREEKIADLRNERSQWKSASVAASRNLMPDNEMTEEEKKENAGRIADSWSKHQSILQKALLLKSENVKQELIAKGHPLDKLQEQVSIVLLADLQEKQAAENNAMCTVITDKDHDFLLKVKNEQRKARREFWMENLSNTLLGADVVTTRKQSSSRAPEMSNISEEIEGIEEMLEEKETEQLAALEQEMKNEKEKRNLQELSEDDMMKLMSDLQRQQEAKRQVIMSSIEQQREAARKRLEEKRKKRDAKQYEEDVALSIISTANKRFDMMREKSTLQKSKQKGSLEDRLRQRREERKRKAEEENLRLEKEREEEEEALKKQKEESSKPKSSVPLPGGGLRREKTVVEEAAEMPDSEKKEIVGVLMREQTTLALRLNKEQTRQEEMVKFLRSKRRQKQEQREQEAATIIGIGERQKTIIASQTKSERERQIASVRDRVARIKYERTMTMKEPKDESSSGFKTLLDDKEVEGLTEDEKMARIAKKMEQKLREEGAQKDEHNMGTEGTNSDDGEESDELQTTLHGGKLDEKMQVQRLKERYMQKKKSRKNRNEQTFETES